MLFSKEMQDMLRNIFLRQRWTEAFIPHRAMRRHVHWVLNTEQYEVVTREWKKAMLNELNFVGIVVRKTLQSLSTYHSLILPK